MPKGKNELQRKNEAEKNFSELLTDLSGARQDYFTFDVIEGQPDEIHIFVANTKVILKSDGTYKTD